MSTDAAWPPGVARVVLAETCSTMDEAAGAAPGPAWILALRQTGARGRRGRTWAMVTGNFAASLVMPMADKPAAAALRSFIAALALRDTFVALSGRDSPFSLKWPNDVLMNGGKVAGILLESLPGTLVIGFGVNLAAAPERAALEPGAVPPVSLREATGITVAPEEFLDHLAPAFARWEARFQAEGFAPIRAAWLSRAARLGQGITARMGGREETGIFDGIDEDGQLVLATKSGRQRIPAADIAF